MSCKTYSELKEVNWSIGVGKRVLFVLSHTFFLYDDFFSYLAVTSSSSQKDLRGRSQVHLSLDLSQSEQLNLDLSPDEFYKLCLEMEKAKMQLELLLDSTKSK